MKTTLWMASAFLLIACDHQEGGKQAEDKAPDPKVLQDPSLPEWKEKAPDEFKAKFVTSKGDFVIHVKREWAPQGADRFYNLVRYGFYDDCRFFRVIDKFMAQFGINGDPKISKAWRDQKITDDPVVKSNVRGWVTYAMAGPNTRTTQLFINYGDNSRLDRQRFSPFGQVVEGMDVVDKLYNGYGEGQPRGNGPDQGRIQAEGNEYLNKEFKQLDHIKTARILKDAPKETPKEPPKDPPKDK